MKKIFLIISLLFAVCMAGQAQNSEQIYSITIDSVKTDPTLNPQVLLCYATIKNLSKEKIEFRETTMYKKHQEERMWNLRIKKNGHTLTWVERHDVYILSGNFTIKKGKMKEYLIPLVLDEMVVDSSGGVGTYTIQIEVSNVETQKVKKQTVSSNIVEFQIKAPITKYSKE